MGGQSPAVVDQSRQLIRLTIALVVAGVAAAGCGGSGKSSSGGARGTNLAASAYHARINAALTPWDIAVHSLIAQVSPGNLRKVASTAEQGADALSGVKPPPSVAGLQPELVATLKRNAIHASRWAEALQTHDTSAAGRLAAEFRQDGREILKIDSEYRSKGITL
jgi:hypothetical protein